MQVDPIKKNAGDRMAKAQEKLKHDFKQLRTGRASAGLLEHIRVEYYGNESPISQVANVVVEDARTISITPWDKGMISAIEKAILASDLGITPNTAGTVVRIVMPALTEERRKDLVKIVKHEAEQARIGIRNVRRDANQEVKELGKKKLITTDEEKRAEGDIQKLTDQAIAKVDTEAAAKEKDLLAM